MGIVQILFVCIVLSCGSWKLPFLGDDLQSFVEATSDSLDNSILLLKIFKGYNLKNVENSQEDNLSKILNSWPSVNEIEAKESKELRKSRKTRSVTETTTASNAINRGTPDLSRFIVNPFRDPTIRFVRLYRFWQPCYVSETLNSESWFGSEARVEYKPSLRSLQNITTATFNVTVNVDESTFRLPILLYGSFSSFPSETNATTRSPTDFVSLGQILPPANSTRTAKVSFQITDFIRRASFRDERTALTAAQKVLVVFLVRRQCNSISSSECSFILNSEYDIPYLKVNYHRNH